MSITRAPPYWSPDVLTVALLAGGLGTRVRSLTGDHVPKALLPVAGRPFIDWKLQELRDQGVGEVVLLVGHGATALEEHLGTGARHGIDVAYVYDGPTLRGTGGALQAALDRLPEAFWVGYADTLLEVPMSEVEARFARRGCAGVMTVLCNHDEVETSNVSVEDGFVSAYDKPATPGTHDCIDYGMLILTQSAFESMPDGPFDLSAVVVPLIGRRELLAFEVTAAFRDVGTPEAHAATDAWLRMRGGLRG